MRDRRCIPHHALPALLFNAASLGLNHGMAHQLGATFHIPHGRANAMLLPHIIELTSDINKHSKSRTEYLPAVKMIFHSGADLRSQQLQ